MKYKRIINTDIEDIGGKVSGLLRHLSSQLSDGYWENIDGYFYEYWNWLDFRSVGDHLEIKVSAEPCWQDAKDIFASMQDYEVVDYIRNALATAYDDAYEVFERHFDGCFVERTIRALFDWSNKEKGNLTVEQGTDTKKKVIVHFTAKELHDIMDCSNIPCEACSKECSSLCRFERLSDYINGKINHDG